MPPHAHAPQAQRPGHSRKSAVQVAPDAVPPPPPKLPRKNKGKEKAIASLAATPASLWPTGITATGAAADILFTPRHFHANQLTAAKTPAVGPSAQPRPNAICDDWETLKSQPN
jgi:hypothetical protein